MTKIKKNKEMILFLLLIVSVFIVVTIISFTIARMSGDIVDIDDGAKVANFNVTVDGSSDNTINCNLLATTKITDIQNIDDNIVNGSFMPGAFQTHTIVVHNNSYVKTEAIVSVENTLNDARVFYIVLPGCADDTSAVYSTLYDVMEEYKDENNVTNLSISDIRAICNDYNSKEYDMGYSDYLRLTLVVWSEHDAVYVDTNNDGVADESSKLLSALIDGIPTENLTVKCDIIQEE